MSLGVINLNECISRESLSRKSSKSCSDDFQSAVHKSLQVPVNEPEKAGAPAAWLLAGGHWASPWNSQSLHSSEWIGGDACCFHWYPFPTVYLGLFQDTGTTEWKNSFSFRMLRTCKFNFAELSSVLPTQSTVTYIASPSSSHRPLTALILESRVAEQRPKPSMTLCKTYFDHQEAVVSGSFPASYLQVTISA